MRDGWSPEEAIDTAPLDHSEEVTGIKRKRVRLALGGAVVFLFLLTAFYLVQRQYRRQHPPTADPKPPPAQQLAQTKDSLQVLQGSLTASYAGQDRRPPAPPKVEVPVVQTAELPPTVPVQPPPVILPPLPPAQPLPPSRSSQQTRPAAAPTPEKKSWRFAEQVSQSVGKPPFPLPEPASTEAKLHAGKLIPPVAWEVPENPNQVLYRDTVIHGQLMEAVNSDVPGDIKIKITRPVTSRFDAEIILLPQDTTLLGVQDGKPEFGMRRLPIKIVEAITPDGRVMAFDKASLGDKHGANGLSGKVNNHWPQLIIATGLTALLQVGARAPWGNTAGYQQTLPQQYSEQFGQGMSQAGKSVIDRQLKIAPTITAKAGEPVTIALGQTLSLQTPPVLVNQ